LNQKAYLLLSALLLIGTSALTPALSSARSQTTANKSSASLGPSADQKRILLDSTATILLAQDAPGPLAKATQDLAGDMAKVFGKKPRIISRREEAGPITILVSEEAKVPEAFRTADLTKPESFSISVVDAGAEKAGAKFILLTGSDLRGTIYAVYEFSEKYLGVDPLYYWTDHEPARRAQISLPASLKGDVQSPLFKYRGFFINDEDLLTGWAPGEKKDGTGISLEAWNKIYETILRLKGNMVAPGTWIFPDEPQIKLAGQRGLIVTQHHAIPLGLNVARWPKDVPYNYTTHPEILTNAWKNAVAEYPANQEVLWTVGLRGLSDISYASMDPSVQGDNKALGRLVSKAIAEQIEIVRAAHPDAQFITNLWQEGARLVQQGDLTIPPGVSTVWADDGYGYIQDKGEVATGQGMYYHDAMMNGRANQLTEMVPVERIYSEFGRYIKAGATHYMLLNTSDVRPVSMTIKAIMNVAWGGLPSGNSEPVNAYLNHWSSQEFGPKAASAVAKVYEDYFKAPAHFGDPEREYGDQYYQTQARRIILNYMIDSSLYAIPSQAPKWTTPRVFWSGVGGESSKERLAEAVKNEIQRCGEVQPRWDAVWKEAVAAEPLVAPDRLAFYRANVLTMITINRESNRILYDIAQAIQAAQDGKKADAQKSLVEALAAFGTIQKAEAGAEYGKWKNWYRGDWLAGIPRTRELTEMLSKYVADPSAQLPPPIFWDGWEAYYHIMHYEKDRSADVN
jgi:hypothetical protein